MKCVYKDIVILIMIGVAIGWGLLAGASVPVPLSGTPWEAAKAIDAANLPLGMYNVTGLPNIGHYCTWAAPDVDLGLTLTNSQQSFVGQNDTQELGSVGNTSDKNLTVINSTSGGMIYL